jgi:predicted phosphoribosyltransferase
MPNFPAMKIIITIPLTQQLQLLELQKFSSQIHCLIFRSQFHSISSIFRQSSLENKEEKKAIQISNNGSGSCCFRAINMAKKMKEKHATRKY